MDRLYYGESTCSATKANGVACTNKAYYLTTTGGVYRCGVHSKASDRTKLAVNPNKDKIILQGRDDHKSSHLAAQESNRSAGKRGSVICSKLAMRKEVPHVTGYLSIFPNKKHCGRTDGLGLAQLSPMNLGPVQHGQPSLPDAKNLENFWQASKLFPSQELCTKSNHDECGDKCFRRYQAEMFLAEEAERHNKYAFSVGETSKGKRVAPLGWVWTYQDHSTNLLKYVESRQFYCTYYERLVRKQEEYATLEALLAGGTNVNIIGYDGRTLDSTLEELYLDGSKPFGHELCLVAMLTLKGEELPWVKHRTEEI